MKKNKNLGRSKLKRNYFTIAILVVTVLMVLYVVQNIYFDASFNAFLSEDSETMQAMEQIAVKFGDATAMMLLIDLDKDDLSVSLAQVHDVITDIRKLPFVNGVDSIFEAQKFKGFTLTAPFIQTGPYVVEENSQFKMDMSILDDDFYVGSLISKDGSTLAITIRKTADYNNDTLVLVSSLLKAINSNTDLSYHLVGEELVNYELFASIQNFTFIYPPIIILAVFAIFMIKFRNLYLSLLIIIGSAYGMHFLSRFMEHDYEGGKKTQLIRDTSQEERTPVFFSAFTTMAGFFSYVFLNMRAFRDMGLFIAIGIFFCALFTMTLIPSLLSFSKNTQKHFQKHKKYRLKIPKWLSIGFIVFTIIGIISAPFLINQIPLEINSYGYFKQSSSLIQGVEHLEEKFNWVSNFYLMAEQQDSDSFTPTPEEVEQMVEIEKKIGRAHV